MKLGLWVRFPQTAPLERIPTKKITHTNIIRRRLVSVNRSISRLEEKMKLNISKNINPKIKHSKEIDTPDLLM